MRDLYFVLQTKDHAVLEFNQALGKSLCLLSVVVAFQKQFKPETQVYYATRTLLDM